MNNTNSNNIILDKIEERLPRYTSYPAAPHFSEISTKTHKKWLKNIPSEQGISLYIHIPFCKKLCWFCGCNTSVANSNNIVSKYVDTLIQEISLLGNNIGSGSKQTIHHIHFGGGSPTILSYVDFSRIMGVINNKFKIEDDTEIAVEIDPRTLTLEQIEHYQSEGVTRASLGIQDFNETVQMAINRYQPIDMVISTFERLRRHGIKSINMDLIFGLPEQTLDSVIDTAKKAVELNPSRISLFPYAHVPWMKKHQTLIDENKIADKEIRLQMAASMRQVFLDAGYVAIGIDHFAKPEDSLIKAKESKHLKRNFQGYSDDKADILIGIGASAISKLPDGYVQNQHNVKEYKTDIWQGDLPTLKGHPLSPEDKVFANVIEELMCHNSADLKAIADKGNCNTDMFAPSLDKIFAIDGLMESGLISIIDDKISLSDENPILARAIASRFDQYLPEMNLADDSHKQYSKIA